MTKDLQKISTPSIYDYLTILHLIDRSKNNILKCRLKGASGETKISRTLKTSDRESDRAAASFLYYCSEMTEVTNGRQSNYLSEVVSLSVAGKRHSGTHFSLSRPSFRFSTSLCLAPLHGFHLRNNLPLFSTAVGVSRGKTNNAKTSSRE